MGNPRKIVFDRFAGDPVFGLKAFQLEHVLELESKGWGYVRGRQHCYLGKLPVFHGHELIRGLCSPVNIARGVYLRVRESAIVGHHHRTSQHVETSGLKNQIVACWSLGCLCELSPEYASVNSWNHGFAIIDVDRDGNFNVSNKIIYDGVVYDQS